jgi:MOSC domain-containing protein YiiM
MHRSSRAGPHLVTWQDAALVAGGDDRWQLAGNQLYVDFDLSEHNIPAGTRLEVGSAVIEISEKPHLGCKKFASRFGREALRFVNSAVGRSLRLRGVNTRIIVPGTVRTGDAIRKLYRPHGQVQSHERPSRCPDQGSQDSN